TTKTASSKPARMASYAAKSKSDSSEGPSPATCFIPPNREPRPAAITTSVEVTARSLPHRRYRTHTAGRFDLEGGVANGVAHVDEIPFRKEGDGTAAEPGACHASTNRAPVHRLLDDDVELVGRHVEVVTQRGVGRQQQ